MKANSIAFLRLENFNNAQVPFTFARMVLECQGNLYLKDVYINSDILSLEDLIQRMLVTLDSDMARLLFNAFLSDCTPHYDAADINICTMQDVVVITLFHRLHALLTITLT